MGTEESQLFFSEACLLICVNFGVFCRLIHLILLVVSILLGSFTLGIDFSLGVVELPVGTDDDLLGFVSAFVHCVRFEFTFEALYLVENESR